MGRIPKTTNLANDLANALLDDIKTRNLKQGDRYHTTAEVCQEFKVCTETASRAMKLLAEQNILVRLRARGTFIGSNAAPPAEEIKRHILFLTMPAPLWTKAPSFYEFPYILDQVMENTSVDVSIVPENGSVSYLQQLKESSDLPDGIVTGVRSQEALQALFDLNIPAVVAGTLDPGMPPLVTTDLDYYQAGQLLTEHLIKKGHHNVMLQMASDYGSDHRLADGVANVLSAAHLPPNSLRFRTFSGNIHVATSNLKAELEQKNHPTAIIAAKDFLAEAAVTAAQEAGLSLGKDIEITWASPEAVPETNSQLTHIQPALSREETAKLMAKLLENQMEGRPIKKRNIYIPAKLHQPTQ